MGTIENFERFAAFFVRFMHMKDEFMPPPSQPFHDRVRFTFLKFLLSSQINIHHWISRAIFAAGYKMWTPPTSWQWSVE